MKSTSNPIGAGTVNLSINVWADERAILGRLAFERGLSFGEMLRRLIYKAVESEDPVVARELAEVRKAADALARAGRAGSGNAKGSKG